MTSKRHEEVGLTDAQVLEMYYYMLLARKIDERQWLLNRAGKVPFVISPGAGGCTGWRCVCAGKREGLPVSLLP